LIEVTKAGSTIPIISQTVTLEADNWNTIAIVGNETNQPLELLPLIDIPPGNTSPTDAYVRFTHAAPLAADLADTRVDICNDGSIWMGLSNIAYKEFTDPYMTVPPSEVYLKVTEAGTNCASVLYEFPGLYFREGQIADMFFIGDIEHQPYDHATTTGLLYILPTPEGYMRFGHFSQFAEDEAASAVTVRIDGTDVLTDFMFKDTTDYEAYDAGDHTIEVLDNTDTVIATSTVTIEEDKYYTSGIIGDADDQPVEIYTLLDETTPLDTQAKLRVVHAAPTAPAVADTAFDVCSNGALFNGLDDMLYKDFTDPYLQVDAGVFNLYVAAPNSNCGDLLWSITAFNLANMDIGDLWILDHDSYCWGCGSVGEEPQVNLAHVAPYENNYHLTGITILLDDEPLVQDFRFLNFSGYMPIPAGTHYVKMIQTTTDNVLATGWITLEGDNYYTLHLIGDGDNQPLEVWMLTDDHTPLDEGAKIRIVHAAPLAPDPNDTLMDVCDADNNLYPGLSDLPYKYFSDPYGVYDAGYYRVKGVQSGKNCDDTIADYSIGLYPYLLSDGDIATIYLFGAFSIPTGTISWPDVSAYMIYLNLMYNDHLLTK